MHLQLSAIPFQQRKTRMYLAAVPIEALRHFSIDLWNPKYVVGRRGYQRRLDQKRIQDIAKFFERPRSIMPVAGLLNVRDKGVLKFNKGVLTIPEGTDVWVVDMQHRLRGLERAREEGALRGDSFRFPVVITEGLSQLDEAAQFYVIKYKGQEDGCCADTATAN